MVHQYLMDSVVILMMEDVLGVIMIIINLILVTTVVAFLIVTAQLMVILIEGITNAIILIEGAISIGMTVSIEEIILTAVIIRREITLIRMIELVILTKIVRLIPHHYHLGKL